MAKAISRQKSHSSSDYDLIANESKACREFAKFPELPTEIRLLIWCNAIPEGRVVPIQYRRLTSTYTARIQPPVVLHISRESRDIGLTIYHELNLGPLKNIGCYVDMRRDTIYLKADLSHGNKIECETEKFKPDLIRGGLRPEKDYFAEPDSQVPPLVLNDKPQPTEPPSYNHAHAILNDLLNSDDGLQVLENFHTSEVSWRDLCGAIVTFRHQMPKQPSKVIIVSERYVDGLPKNIVLNGRAHTPPWDPTAPDWVDMERIRRQLLMWFERQNRKDKQNGRPGVLPTEFIVVYLDDADGEQTLKMLDGAGSTKSRFSALPEETA